MKRILLLGAAVAMLMAVAAPAWAGGPPPKDGDGPGDRVRVEVLVTSQNKIYDSIVGPALPANGPFQKLEMAGPTGLQTEFGPGDPGYVGGRWWVDVNGNNEMDEGDMYFSCPLLGTGRDA